MDVFDLYDTAGGLWEGHCDQVRWAATGRIMGAEGFHDLQSLYVADTGVSGLPTQEWVDVQRCRLEAGGLDRIVVGRMQIPAFTAAIRQLRTPDRTDKKTDSQEGVTIFSDPPGDVLLTGRYVRQQRAEIKAGRRTKATKTALIEEFFEQKGWSTSGVSAMDKQLQPKRYGWVLDVQPQGK